METEKIATPENSQIINILTFDMEEWFHILDLPVPIRKIDWNSLPSGVEKGLDIFLDLLSKNNVKCTFFVLGWVGDKHPRLVRKLTSYNHEVASHGYFHEMINTLNSDSFRKDVRRSKKVLEDITGKKVIGYRGPGFSITQENLWAFDIIGEEGFEYDATVYPGVHGHGGIPGLPCRPFLLQTPSGRHLEEFPITLIKLFGYATAFAGGGYFRFFPLIFISQCFKWCNRRGIPVMSYMHARDLDPDTPRLSMPLMRRIRCYINLSSSSRKFGKLLETFPFGSIRDWRKSNRDNLPVISFNPNLGGSGASSKISKQSAPD